MKFITNFFLRIPLSPNLCYVVTGRTICNAMLSHARLTGYRLRRFRFWSTVVSCFDLQTTKRWLPTLFYFSGTFSRSYFDVERSRDAACVQSTSSTHLKHSLRDTESHRCCPCRSACRRCTGSLLVAACRLITRSSRSWILSCVCFVAAMM